MNTYRVVVKEVHAFPYRVEAASPEEAVQKALEGEGSQDDNDLDNWESFLNLADLKPLRVEVFDNSTGKYEWTEVTK